jgi:hypothetical protein
VLHDVYTWDQEDEDGWPKVETCWSEMRLKKGLGED